ncbi:MAG: RES domain-containing protein [Acidobacteria bacterium]|nr:MAG: RES domain-containing protein [Acidobacteriota bacterium]RPJ74701.1 MAG: RES domain-containing protein [Acidobacteriota bacterium]
MAPRKLPDLPEPSPDLAGRRLPVRPFAGALYRIHRLSQSPAHWGRTGNNRFDDPEAGTPPIPGQSGGAFGVLYAAEYFDGAFIETFGDITPRLVSAESLQTRGVALVTTRRRLALVDLAGPGLAQLCLDAHISTADHALSQRWSRALWAHPSKVDGIWYVTRHDSDQRSVALFDRAASAVRLTAGGGLLDKRNLPQTARAMDRYGFALLP